MRNNSTIESLKAMRFSAMAAELERQMQDSAAYSQMGFEERLSLLVDAEWNCRQNNKLLRCIREARFAAPGAVIEDIEYHEVLSIVTEAYDEEVVDAEKNDTRVVMHFHPALAPYKAAILPLSKKLSAKAQEVYAQLSKKFMIDFDDTGSIGKRYRRQDEIGTPFCITYDFDTLEKDNCVTVRNRDTMEQVRIPIADLEVYLSEKVAL